MRYALIYFFLLQFCFAQSQTRFNINLPIGTDTVADLGTKVIELRNNNFLSCGTTSGFMINYNAAYLVFLYCGVGWRLRFTECFLSLFCPYDCAILEGLREPTSEGVPKSTRYILPSCNVHGL